MAKSSKKDTEKARIKRLRKAESKVRELVKGGYGLKASAASDVYVDVARSYGSKKKYDLPVEGKPGKTKKKTIDFKAEAQEEFRKRTETAKYDKSSRGRKMVKGIV